MKRRSLVALALVAGLALLALATRHFALPTLEAPPASQDPAGLRILVTNDDGIDARGLATLVRELARHAEVVVCAPDRDRSGSSHSMTPLGDEMNVRNADVAGAARAVAISGTPADAAAYGILALGGERGFDFVVSGINRGPNVGELAHRSGTVGAAMEGALRGIPSVAVSQDLLSLEYEDAARFAARFVLAWRERGPTTDVVWSINVPRGAPDEALATSMGGAFVRAGGVELVSEDGGQRRVRTTREFERAAPAGSDTAAFLAGSITLTPLCVDRTDHAALADVGSWGLALGE